MHRIRTLVAAFAFAAPALAQPVDDSAPKAPPKPAAPTPQEDTAKTDGAKTNAKAESSLEYIEIDSEAVGKKVRVGVYLPAGYDASDQRYPTLYFLHGLFGNERKWESRGTATQLDELIAKGEVKPMIVVCPNGEDSFYLKWKVGAIDWEQCIVHDLVEAIDKKYRTLATREQRGLTGDSMGGFGALNLGLRNPKVFGSISAHSAALLPADPTQTPEWMQRFGKKMKMVFGDPVDLDHWKANNPLNMVATKDAATWKDLKIYFDCGKSDRYGFDVTNDALDKEMTEHKVAHEYHLRDGNHGRDYFNEYVPFSLKFHDQAFRATTAH